LRETLSEEIGGLSFVFTMAKDATAAKAAADGVHISARAATKQS
jgi:hypothetical protein